MANTLDVDANPTFYGWLGGVPVLRLDGLDEQEQPLRQFQMVHADGLWEMVEDPGELPLGNDASQRLDIKIIIRPEDQIRLDNALASCPDPASVPSIPVGLEVFVDGKTAWKRDLILQPQIGETTLEWQAPGLWGAWISPDGHKLAVQLGGVDEHPLVVMPVN